MSITLSELRNWNPTHLQDYATHLTALAESHDSTLASVNATALDQAWIGLGRTAQETALAQHSSFVAAGSAALQASAAAASAGANALWGLQQQILAGVDGAQSQGFTVDDQWHVHDTVPQGTPLWFVRESMAETIQATLAGQVQGFEAEERATVAGMTAGASPIAPLDGSLDNTRLNGALLGHGDAPMPPDQLQAIIASLPGDDRYDQLRAELTALENKPCTWGEFRNKVITLAGGTATTAIGAATSETGLGLAVAGIGVISTLNAADSLDQCLDKGLP